ncbi:LacI family DNA-binding transcriptional regulator [Pseudactinotalea sp.]|uniref:LacI family DNA-binding transcriptional regulator n=1 Tax=Pseudactinotalea sp. TaxID=1926260 RepID=UPI003B3B610D
MQTRSGRRATVRDVAARAGVSIATVSRILNNTYTAPPETHQRVMTAVDELDYKATTTRSLSSLAGTIAVAMPHLNGGYFTGIAAGIEEQARSAGMATLIGTTANSADRELAFIDTMRKRDVEATILIGALASGPDYENLLAEHARAMDRAGSRLVLCGRPWTGPADAPVHVVSYDAFAAAHSATTFLLSSGHTRLAHLAGPLDYATGRLRADGFRQALRDFGVDPETTPILSVAMNRDAGYRNGSALIEQGVTAIFTANDELAAGVLAAARERGLGVPADLSVVGFDDIPMARDLCPPLTTLHIPREEMGRTAARMALYGGGEQRVQIGTHIVVRESAAPPNGRSATPA